jgi:hypothetical protein
MNRPTVATMVPVLLLSGMLCPASAQDRDDYRGALAMGKRECTTASIPYPDIRDAAERKQADVTRWCKNEPRSCEGLETKQLIATIEGIPRDIKQLGDDLDGLKRQRDAAPDSEKSSIDSKISDRTRRIEERNKELDFSKRSLDTDRSDADKRIYNGKYCVQARKDVNSPFRDAMSRAKAVTDPALKPFAVELTDIWERCERVHEKDIQQAEAGVAYCERCKSGAE